MQQKSSNFNKFEIGFEWLYLVSHITDPKLYNAVERERKRDWENSKQGNKGIEIEHRDRFFFQAKSDSKGNKNDRNDWKFDFDDVRKIVLN